MKLDLTGFFDWVVCAHPYGEIQTALPRHVSIAISVYKCIIMLELLNIWNNGNKVLNVYILWFDSLKNKEKKDNRPGKGHVIGESNAGTPRKRKQSSGILLYCI